MTPSKPWSQMTPAEQASFLAKVKQFEAKQKAMNQPTQGTGKLTPPVAVEARYPDKPVGTLATDMGSPYPDGTVILGNNPSARKQTRPTKAGRTAMMKSGGSVSSASKRADGCAIKGKTRGKMV